jgi:ABC-type nitrate/sulfonate/bicarbonate transport system permease component
VELVAARSGLGVLLWFGWETFRVSELYAVLVVISILGMLFNFAVARLTAVAAPWMGE